MAKKKAKVKKSRKKAAKKSRRTPAAAAEWTLHSRKPAGGKAAKAKQYQPTRMTRSAMAAIAEVPKGASPSKTRYPVDMETYTSLKSQATTETTAKRSCTVSTDSGTAAKELAGLKVAKTRQRGPAPVAPPASAPTPLRNFEGIKATGWLPPDCTMAAGPLHVVLSVNSSIAVYTTAGTQRLQRTLTQWFSNVVTNFTIFDPKLLYDQYAGRFVLLAVARNSSNQSLFLLSISQTSDPTGGWYNYRLDARKDGTTNTNNWADYPGLGVDSQALYLTANMFRIGGGFAYSKIRVVPKAGPYAGGALTYSDLVNMKNGNGSTAFTVQPCHQFGAPGAMSLVNSLFPSGNQLTLWSLTNPTGTPVLSRRTVRTDPYSLPPDAIQKGGGTPLDTGDVRILNAVSRDGSVWCALTTSENWGTTQTVSAIHWFQINATSGALVQQGIYGSSRQYLSYPALTPDSHGNMIMVFCRSSSSEFASIRFTGRRVSDAAGQLQNSDLLKAGVANYLGLDASGRNRWGDYNGISLDPSGRTVWFYSMFANRPANTWGTWVGASSF